MLRFGSRLKHYGRYSQIVGVLIRHGFGEFIDRMKIRSVFKIGRKSLLRESARVAELTYAERIRSTMEELGPSFIKFGQMLASRPFLIPVELTAELVKLQDAVAPCEYDLIQKTVEEELGKPILELFSEFAREPVASASLAQVHIARTHDGKPVAVKVLRPGVEQMLRIDMDILRDVAGLLEKYVPESRQYKPTELVDELARATRREVDLYYEARNIEVFGINFAEDDRIEIPTVHWEYCSTRVLTTSVVDGIKVSMIDDLKRAGHDLPLLAKQGAQIVFKMIFEDRFFHADPHPGNLFILPGDRWAPVDFGLVGQLSESAIDLLAGILIAANRKDARAIVRILATHDLLPDDANVGSLETEFTELLYRYHKIPLKQINMKAIFADGLDVFVRYNIRMPANLMLLGKAIVTYEEVGRALDPNLNMIGEVEPHIKRLALRKLNPKKISMELLALLGSAADFISEAPAEVRRLSQKLLRGELGLLLRHRGLDRLANDMDRSSNRLSFAIIIGAVIIGSSLIISNEIGLMFHGVSLLGLTGYLIAAALGLGLIISIIRSGRL
ncbi:MAG: ubiquinone biosynthesis protein UbiB [candidate division Zixibacteria bacterium]|nr:ubiquinone biosynthesis protein UbiB [candidate division Zixibacteria bacterium]MBU1469275.1 ubiquinone biosynthesis protein UbiB [candidate division Zixibacteria bacterium]